MSPRVFELGAILKSNGELIQLYTCPQCGYLVAWKDVVWAKEPGDTSDMPGEIKCCRFCEVASVKDKMTQQQAREEI